MYDLKWPHGDSGERVSLRHWPGQHGAHRPGRQAELTFTKGHIKHLRCLKRHNTAPSSLIREMKTQSESKFPKGKWSIGSRATETKHHTR